MTVSTGHCARTTAQRARLVPRIRTRVLVTAYIMRPFASTRENYHPIAPTKAKPNTINVTSPSYSLPPLPRCGDLLLIENRNGPFREGSRGQHCCDHQSFFHSSPQQKTRSL